MFYDTETTGLYCGTCGIHQISGAIGEIVDAVAPEGKIQKFKVLDHFNFKMRPFIGKRVYASALEVGGISYDDIASYDEPKVAYDSLIKIIRKHVDKFNPEDKLFLAGYNSLKFDNDFLRQWFIDCGDWYFGSYFWTNGLDVMAEAGRILLNIRPYMPNFKLGTVAKTLGITVKEEELHDAMTDIRLTIQIFNEILRNPTIRTIDGLNIGRMKEEVIKYREEKKKESGKKGKETYVLFE